MKYHSTLSTIVISISIALLFLFVSGFILASLNLTSPTLMLTNKLFESWEDANSDISIEFASIERNLRDRVLINGLKVSYKEDEIFYFDRLELERGLFSMIGYILSGNGVLNISGDNGRVTIPDISLTRNMSRETGENSSLSFLYKSLDIVLPEEIFSWGISLDLRNIDISYKDIDVENSNLMLYFDHGFEDFSLALKLPTFNYNLNNFNIESNGISFDIDYNKGFDIDFDIDSTAIDLDNLSLNLSDINLSTGIEKLSGITPIDIPIELSYKKLKLDSEKLAISTDRGSLALEDRELIVKLDTISGGYADFIVDIDNLTALTTDLNTVAIQSDNLRLLKGEISLLDSISSEITLDLGGKAISVNLPATWILATDEYANGLIESIYLHNLNGLFSFDNAFSASLYSNGLISSKDMLLSSTTFDLFLGFENSSTLNYELRVDNIKLPTIKESVDVKLRGSDDETQLLFKFGEYISLNTLIDDSINIDLAVDELPLSSISSVVDRFAPDFKSYISEDTALNAAVTSELKRNESATFGFIGNISSSFAIDDIRFNDYSFNLSSELESHLEENELVFDSFELKSDLFNIDYQGALNFTSKLPDGRFSIYGEDNNEFFVLNMYVSDLREYTFYAESPLVDNLNIYGVVNFATENLITSDATLNLFNRINPFDLKIDLADKLLTMENENIDIDVSWADILDISIVFDKLQLSSIEADNISTFDLDFDFRFDFAKQRFDINVPIFNIENLLFISAENSLSFSMLGNNESIEINDIRFENIGYSDITGSALLDLDKNSFAFSISDGDLEKYMLSVIKETEGYFGILRGESINLGRFGLEDMIGFMNLTGRADKLSDFAFSGNFAALSSDSINDSRRINANLYIDNNILTLSDFEYQNGSLSVVLPYFKFDSINGIVSLESAEMIKTMAHSDRDYTISGGISAEAKMEKSSSIIDSIFNLIKTKGNGISVDFSVDYLDIDSSLRFEDRAFSASFNDGFLTLFGEFASGYFDMASNILNISVNADPIGVFSVNGKVDSENGSNFKVLIDKFAVPIANLVFPSPILIFHNPSYLSGEVNILTGSDGLDVFGSLVCDYAEFDVWWLTNERVILHNATFVIWDNDITTVLTDATVLNTETYERVPAKINLGLYFDDSFGFDSWDMDVYIDEPYYINFRLPMVNSNMDIKGKVSGHYRIESINSVIKNSGDLRVKDVVLSIGMDELPYWWNSQLKTTSDFNLLLKENAQFVYPLGPNPILQANLADNTSLGFSLDESGQINLTGDISLRSGEIFYFQKYFYITEGTIGFRNGSSGIDPIVNLRARLRDFDSEGESIDIYLVLRDATLDNLVPTFESSPAKDLNEIMSILGQAILPSTAYGDTSLTTVVSMAAASVDLLSRVGLLGSVDNGLNSTIRDSLSIDTFSLHTNILSNLVADTVSLAASSSGINTFSPMARYLDGTSLYMGKYLTPDLYLQAMVHLSANRNNEKNRFSFIADDLIMDTEISLEWTNPLCTITFFSQPINLTPYGIMDGFGFSLTKRIVF